MNEIKKKNAFVVSYTWIVCDTGFTNHAAVYNGYYKMAISKPFHYLIQKEH